MNYRVLYRKYRPTNFDEVLGQNNTISLLKDSIINEKISHAYIFSGPRGTGKTSTAKIFAKAINCLYNDGGNPCGKCELCQNSNINSDIYEIDAASNNGVDQIREIIDNIKLTPINSKYKVYIIDEVHMLSISAFNALLLTLEEPPSHVVFILATTNIENVPITVLSRCQRLDFKKISTIEIVKNLKNIAKKENINITDGAIEEIAEFSSGGMRDALSILDQLSKLDIEITDEVVLNNVGLISKQEINQMIQGIEDNNIDEIIKFTKKVRDLSSDYKSLINKIIECIKNKAIQIKKGENYNNLTYDLLKKLAFELSSSIYKCNVNIDSYTMLELILLDYVNQSNISREIKQTDSKSWEITENKPKNVSTNSVNLTMHNEKDSKKIISQEILNPFEKTNYNQLVEVRINNCFVNASKTYKEKCSLEFKNFVENLNDSSVKGLLIDSQVVLASDKIIILSTDLKENAELINEKSKYIMDLYNKEKTYYKISAIDNASWLREIEQYKYNKKNNIKYKFKEEPSADNNNKVLEDIFNNDKIEIV